MPHLHTLSPHREGHVLSTASYPGAHDFPYRPTREALPSLPFLPQPLHLRVTFVGHDNVTTSLRLEQVCMCVCVCVCVCVVYMYVCAQIYLFSRIIYIIAMSICWLCWYSGRSSETTHVPHVTILKGVASPHERGVASPY